MLCDGTERGKVTFLHAVGPFLRYHLRSDEVRVAPVSRKQIAVCVIVVKITYNIRSLYAGLDVRAILVGIGLSSRGFGLSTVSLFGRFAVAMLCSGLIKAHDCGVSDL